MKGWFTHHRIKPHHPLKNEADLRQRLKIFTGLFVLGLVLSGLTAIPIVTQFNVGRYWFGADFRAGGWLPEAVSTWLVQVDRGIQVADRDAPFIWYGTDWLAFGHIAVGLAFVGAWRNPVGNRWLYDYGLCLCALVVPWAWCFGSLRGIPWWWRLIDSSFGLCGAIPLWLCRRWAADLKILTK